MKKNLIMRSLAVVIAAVLVATTAVPAYAGEPDGEQTEEILSSDVYESEEDPEEEIVNSDPESEDVGIDDPAENPETEEVIAEAGEEEAEEAILSDANEDDELLGDGEYVAKVIAVDAEEPEFFTDFDEAAQTWMQKGDGAELVLLADIIADHEIESVSKRGNSLIHVIHGTEEAPMILDLNGHGILYTYGNSDSVIRIEMGSFLELKDNGSIQNIRYLKINDRARATEIVLEKSGESDIQISGGFIAGGHDRGGVANAGTLKMSGGTICGNDSGGAVNAIYATFVMSGGKICRNAGDGVNNISEISFKMTGGEISDNGGSGVHNTCGPFEMSGGKISGNICGGVYNKGENFEHPSFKMSGGEISGNTAGNGAGVCNSTETGYVTFEMTGGKITGNTATNNGGGVYNEVIHEQNVPQDYSAISFVMSGGEISNNTAGGEGGGVCLYKDYYGTYKNTSSISFKMSDGKICGNKAATYGGGVDMHTKDYNDGHNGGLSFEMSGGEISDNSASQYGGGVLVQRVKKDNDASFEMNGGEILGNNSPRGGGICVAGSVFTLNEGEISGNTAEYGGGVYIATTNIAASPTMNGGEISGNTATAEGGGVYHSSGSFKMSGGEISKNTAPEGNAVFNGSTVTFDGSVCAGAAIDGADAQPVSTEDAKSNINSYGYVRIIEFATVKAGDEEQVFKNFGSAVEFWNEKGAAGAGPELKLLTDIEANSTIGINGGTEEAPMVLDLNGHGILYTGGSGESVISINSGKFLELKDTGDTETVRYVKLGEYGRGTAVAYSEPDEGDYLQISGGYIAGGSNCGVLNNGTLTMNGGTICGNHAFNGGGVVNKGNFTMNAGAICGNKANADTGGGVVNTGTFTMNGGVISGNSAEQRGGGVSNTGTFIMSAGEISGNLAPDAKALFNNGGTVDFDGDVCAGTAVDGTGARIIDAEQAKTDLHTYGYIALLGLRYEPIEDVTYTGSAIAPTIRAYFGDRLLKEKTDYTVKFRNNTNVGKAEFTVTFKGNYTGKVDGEFYIVPKNIGDDDVTVAEIASKAEGKNAYKPVPTITYNKKKLAAAKDFTVQYFKDSNCTQEEQNPKAAQRYWVKISATEKNFTGTRVVPFIITAAQQVMVSKLTIEKIPDQKYNNGAPIEPGLIVKNGKQSVGTDCFDISYKNNTEIGTASVTITGKEDKGYFGSKTATFKIVGGALGKVTVNVGSFQKAFPYNGTAQKNFITLTDKTMGDLNGLDKDDYDKLKDKSSVDYVISYENNVNAGTATMILTGVNGWAGTIKKTFKIDKFDIKKNDGGKLTIELDPTSYPYAKAGVKPKPEVRFNGKLLYEGTDYTLAYANNTAVGGAKAPTIKITGKGNFTGVNDSKTFVIGKANLADAGITVTAKDIVWANKKGNYKTTVTVADKDGKVLKLNTDYVLSFSTDPSGTPALGKDDKVNLGAEGYTTVYVTVSASESAKCTYEGSISGTTFRLCENDIGKLTATVADRIFTGRAVTIAGNDIKWKSGKTDLNLTEGTDFEIIKESYEKNVDKGTASVMVKGKGKYSGTKKVTFKIQTKTVSGWKSLLRSLFAWL
ncbi:MAG: hypothetical protein J5518_09345 [Lachnospiraceae bacterium]|nr:hypothetical protein [Lachnospiraceae bacterium]